MMHQEIAKSERLLRLAIAEHVTLSPDAMTLFDLAFEKARVGPGRRMIAPGWVCSTLNSRLDRDGLPGVWEMATVIRKAHAAQLFDRCATATDVAYLLGCSSPQTFGRWTRTHFGLTPTAFRATVAWPCVRAEFLERFVTPHVACWVSWTYYRGRVRQIAPVTYGAPRYAEAA